MCRSRATRREGKLGSSIRIPWRTRRDRCLIRSPSDHFNSIAGWKTRVERQNSHTHSLARDISNARLYSFVCSFFFCFVSLSFFLFSPDSFGKLRKTVTHVLKVRRIQARCLSSVDASRRAGLLELLSKSLHPATSSYVSSIVDDNSLRTLRYIDFTSKRSISLSFFFRTVSAKHNTTGV